MSGPAQMMSSLVMTLPLIAVPCVAMFGLPSLGPTAAEADVDPGIELQEGSDEIGQSVTEFSPFHDPNAKLGATGAAGTPFSMQNAPGAAPAAETDRSAIDPTTDRRAAAANLAVGLEVPQHSHATEASGTKTAAANPEFQPFTRTAGTWDDAVARMAALGIQDFRLSPSDVRGEFHFSCAHRGTNSTRRFEAEAANPLAAALDALAQVESWKRSQP